MPLRCFLEIKFSPTFVSQRHAECVYGVRKCTIALIKVYLISFTLEICHSLLHQSRFKVYNKTTKNHHNDKSLFSLRWSQTVLFYVSQISFLKLHFRLHLCSNLLMKNLLSSCRHHQTGLCESSAYFLRSFQCLSLLISMYLIFVLVFLSQQRDTHIPTHCAASHSS